MAERGSGLGRWIVLFGIMGYGLAATGQAVVGASGTPTADGAAYVPTMVFDVASVRPMKVTDSFSMSMWIEPHTSMLRLQNNSIDNLLYVAYLVRGYQIAGLPDWPWPTLFTIEAKADSEADEKLAKLSDKNAMAEKQHMLQAVLSDRFKLRVHWETREGPTYNLVVSKAGRLEGSKSVPPSAQDLTNFADGPTPTLYQRNDGRGYDYIGHACPMSYLVEAMIAQFNRPIMDKTGRSGEYDFFLKYGAIRVSDPTPDENDPLPSLENAIQDQLGLKLESAKGPIRVLVIDHVEKPSEN